MRSLFIITFILHFYSLYAGGIDRPTGARSAGMAYTGQALADLWGIRLNPAGIAGIDAPTAGLFYQNHFLSQELSDQAIAVAIPFGNGCFGIGADHFGYTMYRETRASLAYAMRFGEGLRAAVQLNHVGIRLGENYGSAGVFIAEVGMQAKLTEALWIGAHVYNPNRSSIGGPYDDRTPAILSTGLTYTFSEQLFMNGEVEKDIDRDEQYRIGLEYRPNKVLFLRTGWSTGPVQAHFGIGFKLDQLEFDLAMAVRSQLGPSPMIGLNYRFG